MTTLASSTRVNAPRSKCAVEDYDGAYSLASTEMRDAFKGLEGFKSIASGFKGLRNIKELSGNDSGWQLFGGYPASVPDDIVAAGTAPRQPVDCILAFHEGRLQGAYRPASSQPSMAFPFSKAKTDWDIFAERLKVLAALSGRVRERRAPAAVSASSKFWLTGAYIGEFGEMLKHRWCVLVVHADGSRRNMSRSAGLGACLPLLQVTRSSRTLNSRATAP